MVQPACRCSSSCLGCLPLSDCFVASEAQHMKVRRADPLTTKPPHSGNIPAGGCAPLTWSGSWARPVSSPHVLCCTAVYDGNAQSQGHVCCMGAAPCLCWRLLPTELPWLVLGESRMVSPKPLMLLVLSWMRGALQPWGAQLQSAGWEGRCCLCSAGGPGPIQYGVSNRVAGLAPCPVGCWSQHRGTARRAGGEGAAGVICLCQDSRLQCLSGENKQFV